MTIFFFNGKEEVSQACHQANNHSLYTIATFCQQGQSQSKQSVVSRSRQSCQEKEQQLQSKILHKFFEFASTSRYSTTTVWMDTVFGDVSSSIGTSV